MIFCYGRLSRLIQEVSRSQRKNVDGEKRKQQYMLWRQDFSLLSINSGKPKASRENEPSGGHLYVCVPVNLLLLLLLLSRFSRVWFCGTHRRQPTRLPHLWDSPGKNTGVGCHFLLQCIKVKSENEVTQSCPTLSDPMDCSLPGSSVHGIFQARVLE